jgi:hypothetical protein
MRQKREKTFVDRIPRRFFAFVEVIKVLKLMKFSLDAVIQKNRIAVSFRYIFRNQKDNLPEFNPEGCLYSLGNVLLSQNPAVQVPLALEGLTVVFEMGTRGSPPPSLPNIVRKAHSRIIP